MDQIEMVITISISAISNVSIKMYQVFLQTLKRLF